MATGYELRCKNCGFEAKARSGFSASGGGRSFVFFGCPACKEIMTVCTTRKGKFYVFKLTVPPSLKEMTGKEKGLFRKGLCPGCGGKMIDYMNDKTEQKRKDKYGSYTCPRCGKSALHMERMLDIY